MSTSVQSTRITRVCPSENQTNDTQPDLLAVEEPLAIRLGFGPVDDRQQRPLSVTMRTPGHDAELTLGFLLSEGIIRYKQDIVRIRHCTDPKHPSERGNTIRVELAPTLTVDWKRLERYSYTSSSCGVCGKTSVEAVNVPYPAAATDNFLVTPEVIHAAPSVLRQAQLVFEHTGGLHAAGLFNQQGKLVLWHEDVGRHNALDKLLGAALQQDRLPLRQAFVLLSGRISFELVQKALMAGVPLLAAVGAPSSLAVRLASTLRYDSVGVRAKSAF